MGLLEKERVKERDEARLIVPEPVLDPEGESVTPAPSSHSPFVGFAAGILSG